MIDEHQMVAEIATISPLDELATALKHARSGLHKLLHLADANLARVSADRLLAMDNDCRDMLDNVSSVRAEIRSLRTAVLLANDSVIEVRHLDLVEEAEQLGKALEALTINWAHRVENARKAIRHRAAT